MSDPAFLRNAGERMLWVAALGLMALGYVLLAAFILAVALCIVCVAYGVWMLGLGGQIIVGVVVFFAIAIGCLYLGEYLTEKFKE
jgi:hypothetical protein